MAATGLAAAGHQVIGIERAEAALASLRAGRSPFLEPGLEESMSAARDSGRLEFAAAPPDGGEPLDAAVIAVGTPSLPSGGTDLRDIAAAIEGLGAFAPPPRLVVLKSTVPPGTSEDLLARSRALPGLAERYAFSPEFLSQGTAVANWREPARIVIGTKNRELLPLLRDLYRAPEGTPWVVTSPTSAEMVKYASNAFLATRISFVNEIAGICGEVGADIDAVLEGMSLDPRVGSGYLRPGVGYGGSCFPKDNRALTHLSKRRGRSLPLLEAVITVNNLQRLRVVSELLDGLREVERPAVAVAGLAFKPGTDDLREAPSTWIVPELQSATADVRLWDPAVTEEAVAAAFPGAALCGSLEAAADCAHGVLILTEWPEIVGADWARIAASMARPKIVVDGRNCLVPEKVRALGMKYRGIGRA